MYPISLTLMPTPLEVAKSSIVAPKIFSVFVTTNTALLQKDLLPLPQFTLWEGARHFGCPHGVAYCEVCKWIPMERWSKTFFSWWNYDKLTPACGRSPLKVWNLLSSGWTCWAKKQSCPMHVSCNVAWPLRKFVRQPDIPCVGYWPHHYLAPMGVS